MSACSSSTSGSGCQRPSSQACCGGSPGSYPVDLATSGPGRPGASGSAHFAGAVAGLGAGEAERRPPAEAGVAAIVRAEAAEREAAASQYERSGHAGQAAGMRQGTRALMDALDGPASDGGTGEQTGWPAPARTLARRSGPGARSRCPGRPGH
jgi:hypothetical protein